MKILTADCHTAEAYICAIHTFWSAYIFYSGVNSSAFFWKTPDAETMYSFLVLGLILCNS